MPISFSNTVNKTAFAGNRPVFQVQPVEYDVMGYMLQNAPAAGVLVAQGTPLVTTDSNKQASICKYAVIERKVDAKNFYVKDLGFFAVGDKFFISGSDNPSLSTISAIDTASKKITLSANNASLAAGDIIVEGKVVAEGSGDEAIVPVAIPNRIVSRSETMREGNKSINAAFRAVAIQNVLHYPAEWLNDEAFPGSILLKGNPHILFVTQ